TDRSHQLVVRNGIEGQVVAQAAQVKRLVIEHGSTRREREHVFVRGLGVHRNQEIDFLLARDIAVFVGADGVPRGQSRNVRRKKILTRDRYTHLENTAEKHGIGAL